MPFDFDHATAGSARFSHMPFDGRWMGGAALPAGMRILGGCLDVDLAAGVARSDVAQSFGQAMADRRFDRVAQRPDRVRRRFASGRRLEVPCRYSAPPSPGCDGRVRIVDDVFEFRPRLLRSVVASLEASVRILSMCSALADAAALGPAREVRHA